MFTDLLLTSDVESSIKFFSPVINVISVKGQIQFSMKMTKIDPMDISFRNNWNKPIHRWYRFHAGCSLEFPEKMIETLKVKKKETIFDPFCGSGTVLLCAKKRGINSIGFDVNPFYVFISRVKTYWSFDPDALSNQIELIEKRIRKRLATIFSHSSLEINNVPKYIWRYFQADVLMQLSVIKKEILDMRNEHVQQFLLLALASVLIDVSKVHHVGETIVFNKHRSKQPPVLEVLTQKILEMYSDLRTVWKIKDVGNTSVDKGDIRNLDELIRNDSVDHVITHPPYANNYNYLLHDRLPLYFLDYFKTSSDEKKMRNSILGSVIKNKVTQNFIPVTAEVEKIAQRIEKTWDIERYKAVLEYFDTMNSFLETLFRKLKRKGYCAMLLGNSYVRGVMIPLDVLIAKMARKIGFQLVDVSKVRDRGDGAFQHLYNGKLYESVVLLKHR